MPNAQLIARYKELLKDRGLALPEFDQAHWEYVLRGTHAIKVQRILNAPTLNDAEVEGVAFELARNGGVWNTRFQRLAPSVVEAANNCLRALSPDAVDELRIPSAEYLFFGELPIGEFQAVVEKVDSGYLILLNTGLAELLGQLSRVLSQALDDDSFRLERVTAGARYVASLSKKWVEGGCFVALRNRGEWREEDAGDLEVGDWMFQSMLAFVIGHELAHIALNHSGGSRKSLTIGPRRSMNKIVALPSKWQCEVSSDILGAIITERWGLNELNRRGFRGHEEIWLCHAVSAPIFCLEFDRILSAQWIPEQRAADVLGHSHPPAYLRLKFLIEHFQSHSDLSRFALHGSRRYRQYFRRMRRLLQKWRIEESLDENVKAVVGDARTAMKYMRDMVRAQDPTHELALLEFEEDKPEE